MHLNVNTFPVDPSTTRYQGFDLIIHGHKTRTYASGNLFRDLSNAFSDLSQLHPDIQPSDISFTLTECPY